MTWFSPEGTAWTYASRRLITARLLTGALLWLPFMAATVLWGVLAGGWFWTPAVVVALVGVWVTWLVVRQVTAHAWAERDDDLIVKRGRLFRSVSVVPYGRMQYVEVTAGPLNRALGIASLQLHTAAPATDARLAGVPADQAARLRDRLTERGEARLAGL